MIDGRAPPPVFVGELNPYGGNDRHALFPVPIGSAGHRLQALICGIRRSPVAKVKPSPAPPTPRPPELLPPWDPDEDLPF